MRSAIIDIGYNAIRAVVYESDTVGAPEIFNDKFKNDIHHLLASERIDIPHQTYLCIQHFIHIFQKLSVTRIKCVATAVLRNHPKAQELCKIIKNKYNINIEIISGEQEAYLTAFGLISGISNANGIAADLGGGSLELVSITQNKIGHLKSLALGTKIINQNRLNDINIIKRIIIEQFGKFSYQNLYLIGGAFRLIGRFYMAFANYPLKNLHNLEIANANFILFLDQLEQMHKSDYDTYNKGKIDFNAVIVAKSMIEVFKPQNILISNYGLKEGLRFISLNQAEQEKNIIFEKVKALVQFDDIRCKLDKYCNAIQHLLIDPDSVTLSTLTLAIMFIQFSKNIDKALRANFAVELILASDIPFNHRQRIMLSLICAFVYQSKPGMQIYRLSKRLLSKKDYNNSQIIGNFIRIARKIDGPEFLEPSFALKLKSNNSIEIGTKHILPYQLFNKVCASLEDIKSARKSI